MIITPYLSAVVIYLIESVKNGQRPEIGDINYLASFMTFTKMPNLAVFLMQQILVMGFLAYLILIMPEKQNLKETGQMKITPEISIPVPAGSGQYGKERFLTEKEKRKKYGVFEYTGKEDFEDNKVGLVVEMKKKGNKEIILYNRNAPHSMTMGSTGCGKTRRVLMETVWLQLMAGVSVVVSDVKGEIYYYANKYARSCGYKEMALDLRTPEKSIHYNFLTPILDSLKAGDETKAIEETWDLVACLVKESNGEAIWYNGECATIAASILAVAIEAPEQCKNMANVYYFLAYMCQADENGITPINDYMAELPDDHPAKGVFAIANVAPFRTRASFFTSALGTLRLFTNPKVAEMSSRSDFRLEEICRGKVFFSMMIPDEKKTLYPLVSIFITQLYMKIVDEANSNGGRVLRQVQFDLDELGNFPFIPVLGAMYSAGRSRGVGVNGVIQDYQQIEVKYKEEYKNIMTNAGLKVLLKTDDASTLKMFSELLGTYTVEMPGASTSSSISKEANYGSNKNLGSRELLKMSEISRIRAPYALCKQIGEYAAVTNLPDLSEYYANEIMGLGDEKHNQELISRQENAREARRVKRMVELWGIWNNYSYDEIDEEESEDISATGEVQRKSFL